jgi:tetratricopeptide (TPR) repeat protein
MHRTPIVLTVLAAVLLVSGCAAPTPNEFTTPRLDELSAKIAAKPDDAQALVNRGYALALLDQRGRARTDLERAVKLANTGPIHNQAGWAYFNMGDATAALRHWEIAADLSKRNARYDYYSLALGYWVNDDVVRAVENYDLAAKRDERFADADMLRERTANWTPAERLAILAIHTAWSRAYRPGQ